MTWLICSVKGIREDDKHQLNSEIHEMMLNDISLYYMPTNHSHAKPLSKPNLVN